jgi:hypothetical protein
MPEQALSAIQAYTAMVHFLEAHLARTGSEDVASLLGDLARRTDGTTADPAAWEDWQSLVQQGIVVTKSNLVCRLQFDGYRRTSATTATPPKAKAPPNSNWLVIGSPSTTIPNIIATKGVSRLKGVVRDTS